MIGQKFCEQCGKPLAPGVRFCESCGAAVADASVTTAPVQGVAPPPIPPLPQAKSNASASISQQQFSAPPIPQPDMPNTSPPKQNRLLIFGIVAGVIVLLVIAYLILARPHRTNAPVTSQSVTSAPDIRKPEDTSQDNAVLKAQLQLEYDKAEARYKSAYEHYANIVTTHPKSDVESALQEYKDAVAAYNDAKKRLDAVVAGNR